MKALGPERRPPKRRRTRRQTAAVEMVAVGERGLHEQTRMLAIDQRVDAGQSHQSEQQRVALLTHERDRRRASATPGPAVSSRRAMNMSMLVEKVWVSPRRPPCSS
jgi:hypothetical protein